MITKRIKHMACVTANSEQIKPVDIPGHSRYGDIQIPKTDME